MNILLIGNDCRCDALGNNFLEHNHIVYATHANAGMQLAGCQNIPINPEPENFDFLCSFAKNRIDLVVVGPEEPLAAGIVNAFQKAGIPIFGPTREASEIEWSKIYAHELMVAAKIPTPEGQGFREGEVHNAIEYVRKSDRQFVIKADGLCKGKGVQVCSTSSEAINVITDFMTRRVKGDAGKNILIQKRMYGEELSVFALCDGKNYKILPIIRDYKRLNENDDSPMTGGMGAYGPISMSEDFYETIEEQVIIPCLKELALRGTPFVGCLFIGLMLTKEGPKVLEFNARFGDPETQVHMRLIDPGIDYARVLLSCTDGTLDERELIWRPEPCYAITLAVEGYPLTAGVLNDEVVVASLPKGKEINDDNKIYDSKIYFGGVRFEKGRMLTSGNRVLTLTSLIKNVANCKAREWAYKPIDKGEIYFRGMQYRRDIGAVC